MEDKQYIKPVSEYSIDSIPLNKDEFIKLYDSVIEIFQDADNLCGILDVLATHYRIMMRNSEKLTVTSSLVKPGLFFIANTGYFLHTYKLNETLFTMLLNQPDLAITDIDKALLAIIDIYYKLLYTCDESERIIKKEYIYTFIFFLHNVQNYEYKTHKTLDLSSEKVLSYGFDEGFIFDLFTNPLFTKTDSKMLTLSENEINSLKDVLEYRKELNEAIVLDRKNEQDYAENEVNNAIWEQFITWLDYRCKEERNALEMINSSVFPVDKLNAFDRFLAEINDPKANVLNSELCLRDLKQKIFERFNRACNYMEINTSDRQNYALSDFDIHSIFSPYSFSCVLISYHAFLINPSNRHLEYLTTSLEGFIRNNLDNNNSKIDWTSIQSSIIERLISVSDLIIKFYEEHKETISKLRFDSIQEDDTLSGIGYYSDILRLLGIKERKILKEILAAYNILDSEDDGVIVDDLDTELGENSVDDINDSLQIHKPNSFDDEDKLLEQIISNRLIVSINAIYILVKTMDRLLEQGKVQEEYRNDAQNSCKLLSKLEKHLVRTTYIAPDFNCFDDIDMDEYREKKGIDASKIELKNNERIEMLLFGSARRSIRALHDETQNINYEKASIIKSEIRDELKDLPDSELKDFIIELVDQECQDLCNSLIENESRTADFETTKKQMCDYIGSSSKRLPARTINALTTAELLFAQYASAENKSASFDYSGISALYYQAVESMYNELIWKDYAEFLYKKRCGDNYFLNLYRDRDKELPVEEKIYLPVGGQFKFWDYEKKRISDHLMMGSFNMLLRTITSTAENPLMGFREHVDGVFGRNIAVDNADEYKSYQKRIDELYSLLEVAKIRRNAASHGASPINIEECRADRALVLSDVEAIRKGILGIVMLFLSLYKDK